MFKIRNIPLKSNITTTIFLQDTYNSTIQYFCKNGSQFDTDSVEGGDAISVEIRCQWNKDWFPYKTTLPTCKITHCITPFPIPPDTKLEVLLMTN